MTKEIKKRAKVIDDDPHTTNPGKQEPKRKLKTTGLNDHKKKK